jgi:putative ABC transport system permease protein
VCDLELCSAIPCAARIGNHGFGPSSAVLVHSLPLARLLQPAFANVILSAAVRILGPVVAMIRSLARQPRYSLTVITILAIALGGAGAMFTLVNALLLKPLPYQDAERLVLVGHRHSERGEVYGAFSPQDFADLTTRTPAIESAAAFWYAPGQSTVNAVVGDRPMQLESAYVSGQFFATLGGRARLGRALQLADDHPGVDVAVLSHRAWTALYGSNPDVVGRDIRLQGRLFRIIGVMPPEFEFPDARVQVYLPRSVITDDQIPSFRGVRWLQVIARLDSRLSPEAAAGQVDATIGALAMEYPESNAKFDHAVLRPLYEQLIGKQGAPMSALLVATVLLMLVACGNLANLLLARALAGERELVLRCALGASPKRLAGQMVGETLMLTLAGSALGVVLAIWMVRAYLAGLPIPMARQAEIGVDWRVLSFGIIASVLSAVFIAWLPARRASRLDPAQSLSRGGASTVGLPHTRMRSALVVGQIALVCALGYATSLTLDSMRRVLAVDTGVDESRVLSFNVKLQGPRYDAENALPQTQARILAALRELPGVRYVGGSKNAPFGESGEGYPLRDPTMPDRPMRVDWGTQFISSDYFAALGAPMLRGREFDGSERPGAAVTLIINQALADRYYPGIDPVGKRVQLGDVPAEIIGVASNIRHAGPRSEIKTAIYLPISQISRSSFNISMRVEGASTDLIGQVRRTLAGIDPELPIVGMRWLDEQLASMESQPRQVTQLLSAFASLSMLIAALGVFSLLTYIVGERRQDMAVRLAIGATPARLLTSILGFGLRLGLLGILVGLPLGVLTAGLLRSILFDTQVIEPGMMLATLIGVLLLTALAALAPALSTMRTPPAHAIRQC